MGHDFGIMFSFFLLLLLLVFLLFCFDDDMIWLLVMTLHAMSCMYKMQLVSLLVSMEVIIYVQFACEVERDWRRLKVCKNQQQAAGVRVPP